LREDCVNHSQLLRVKYIAGKVAGIFPGVPMMSIRKKSLHLLLLAATALFATAALAGEITLFQDRDFRGDSLTLRRSAPNLLATGFNDSASSIVIRDGIWEACTDTQFQGRCVQLQPGEYRMLGALNDRIASVRELVSVSAVPPVSRAPAPVIIASAEPRMVLFEQPGFGGRSVEVTQTMGRLDTSRFYAGASAAVIYGGSWRLCSDDMFRGECAELPPGQYDSLGTLNGRVSSAELLARVPVVGIAPAPVAAGRVVLFDSSDFRGKSLVIDRSVEPNLQRLGFDDRAASMRIEQGTWTFCTDERFQGQCRTFGPGEYPRLPGEFYRRIVSARLVNDVYGAAPNVTPYVHWQPMS
jgi:beta/gamma crystallin